MAQALHAPTNDAPTDSLLRSASIEASPRDSGVAERLTEWFAPGAQVFLNFLPGSDYRRSVEAAVALRRVGFEPVPHLSARGFASRAELADTLARFSGEAGGETVLAIGGDIAVPRGPFASTLELIETGVLRERGIKSVGLAAYPEGHHTLDAGTLQAALAAKLAAVRAQGMRPFVVTQFCFESAPILDWLTAARRAGVDAQVRIGVAGPASLRTLLTFAMKCGVGNSLRVLLNQPQSIGRLLRDASPDDLVREISEGLRARHAAGVSLHLFPFGGLAKTAEWRRRAMV